MTLGFDYIPIAKVNATVDGTAISTDLQNEIVEFVAETNMHLPDMGTITFHTTTPDTIEGTFDIGKALVITVNDTTVFTGEVTALEPDFTEGAYVFYTIRAYDKSHRLHRGRKTKNWLSMTDSAIASAVIGAAGLTASVDSTSDTWDHVWQHNQSDFEFLKERAYRNGYSLWAQDGSTMNFKKYAPTAGPTLTWGMELRSFRPRLVPVRPISTSNVKSWDPATKAAVVGTKTAATSTANHGGFSSDPGSYASGKFSAAESSEVGYPGLTSAFAGTFAQSIYDEAAEQVVEADGVCIGNPAVKAGVTVTIANASTKFNGTYMVTAATHVFSNKDGYETHFSISGRDPDTLADALGVGQGEDNRHLVTGVVPALVTNNNDPKDMSRVKLKYPWLDDSLESDWARLATPGGGSLRGIYYLPEVNDEVLVAFEHGDFNRPYVVGGLYNGTDKVPVAIGTVVASGKVNQRIIKSRSGHIVILDDTQGAEQILIKDKTGNNSVLIDSVKNAMTILVDDTMTVTAKGKVTVTSTTGDMEFSANNVTVTAKQNMTLKATGKCDVTSTGAMTLKSTAAATLEGTASCTVKDGAGAQVALSGPSVNVNNGALEVI